MNSMVERHYGIVRVDAPSGVDLDANPGEFERRSGTPVVVSTHTIVDLVRRRIAEIDEILEGYGVTVS